MGREGAHKHPLLTVQPWTVDGFRGRRFYLCKAVAPGDGYAPVDSLILWSIWTTQVKLVDQEKEDRKTEVGVEEVYRWIWSWGLM